jgi:hypothetical protein
MRTKTQLFASGFPVILAATILVSCHKNDELKPNSSVTANNKEALSKHVNLQNLLMEEDATQLAYALDPSLAISDAVSAGSCPPIVTYDNPPGVYPRTVTTDYGTGCYTASLDITRSGKILRTYFGDMADTTENSYYIEYYDNYYVKNERLGFDSMKIEGSLKMRHESKNQDPQNAWRSTQRDRKLTEINGDYNINNGYWRFVKYENDGGLPNFTPKGWFRITGVKTNDVMSGGEAYQIRDSIDLANPMIYKFCDYAVKGNRIIDFTNQPTWFVNFGTTLDCDDQAELTIQGVTTTITLPLDLWD